MPADRRIIVQVQAEGFRDPALQGEFVPGEIVDYPMWASRRDQTLTDIATEGGTRDQARRTWRIRWNSLIASTPTDRLGVVDGTLTFSVANMTEVTAQRGGAPDLRRRFIDLEGLYET